MDRIVATASISLIVLLATTGIGVLFIIKLPSNYFVGREMDGKKEVKRSIGHYLLKLLKSLIGAVLILVGVGMIFLPGPGLLSILVGILLLDFPEKHQFVQKIAHDMKVFVALNRLRECFGKQPFQINGNV